MSKSSSKAQDGGSVAQRLLEMGYKAPRLSSGLGCMDMFRVVRNS